MSGRPDGIVLAGGPGSRLGGSKASALLAGRPLVAHAVALLRERCDRVVVATRAGVDLPDLDVPVVEDLPGQDGPLAGIAAGLAWLSRRDPGAAGEGPHATCLVLACDLPLAGPALDRLIARGAHAAVAVDASGRLQPLCARYPAAAALAACTRLLASGTLAATALADALDATRVPATDVELLNVNAPADLARAARLAQSGSTSTTAL